MNALNNKTLPIRPRLSEKAFGISQRKNIYVFDVPLSANKMAITSAVETQFNVSVISVKTTVVKGKVKRSYQKRSRPIIGRRSDIKKAYVRVAEGNIIAIFNENESDNKGSKQAATKKEIT